LMRLPLFVASGHASWGGLVVCFPGSKEQLATGFVGTPYLRKILYPILDLHQRVQDFHGQRLPCLYLLGARFPDVILRKFGLLDRLTPHVVALTGDLLSSRKLRLPKLPQKVNEAWVQAQLCKGMASEEGLKVLIGHEEWKLGYIASEVPTGEGTKNPERLDILGYDRNDGSLVAFEIKGPNCNRVELENLFLQGIEHRDWLERNKMAVKLIFDGPKGKHINTRKRVRLILGFFQDQVPPLFHQLRSQALRKDQHLKIDFVRFSWREETGSELIMDGVDF